MSNAAAALLLCKHNNLTTLLQHCKSISHFKKLHAIIITFGIPISSQETTFISNFLSFAATFSPNIHYPYTIFLRLQNPSIFNYNTIIRAFSNAQNPNKSISIFNDMLRKGLTPDHLTYPFVTKAASRLQEVRLGLSIHGRVMKDGFEADRFVKNSLIHFAGSFKYVGYARKVFDEMTNKNLISWNSMLGCYVKCREVVLAREVFDSMAERNVVSWSSMIDGYVKCGEYSEALDVFGKMKRSGVDANEVTMVSVLGACAHLGALEQGVKMHSYIVEKKISLTLVLRTSLVDMYAKCGAIKEALTVFCEASMKHTDVLIWNAMIGGLATHGLVQESLDLFKEMQNVGIAPDEITYLCILSACAHGGLVNEAWYYFKCLTEIGLNLKTEHYACMMDALARAGQLMEAYTFLTQMPMEPTPSMLGALFNGCINHRNFDLAEVVGKKLVELQPDHDGRYVGLSNVYAVIKRWDEARMMRETMEKRGVKKLPGWSLVEIFGSPHRFIAHDKTHPQYEHINDMLNFVLKEFTDPDFEMSQHDYSFGTVDI
uniref:pentatricopeptide repeat-containing protein At5g08305-like n=1 Tax=Erigeron canadensis TaxID=72917 RepID=UPI001CB8CC55|nr:pentatricopeptide repeat-containing protein At5g08305-like [Erigeron canadensis]